MRKLGILRTKIPSNLYPPFVSGNSDPKCIFGFLRRLYVFIRAVYFGQLYCFAALTGADVDCGVACAVGCPIFSVQAIPSHRRCCCGCFPTEVRACCCGGGIAGDGGGFAFFSQPQCCIFGHFPHLLVPIIKASKQAHISGHILNFLIIPVNNIEPPNLLLVSRQSISDYNYSPSRFTTVSVSSRRFIFNWPSMAVLAVMDGLPFTSTNQGFSCESIRTSNPYSSKHLLSFSISLEVATNVFITSSCMLKKHYYTGSLPNRLNM